MPKLDNSPPQPKAKYPIVETFVEKVGNQDRVKTRTTYADGTVRVDN